ncbi:hypothetical protein BGX27_008315 [Mortierella sp. AM989]|nr:hypothetical protein BGX27_008315 [Mortierella sp. AM989]
MRFQAQRREQKKKVAPFVQELEESKARLGGLEAALEFIQAEQENLVERVVSPDEQQSKLEAMSKGSRAVGQKMIHLENITRKLIEMIRINHQNVRQTANEVSEDITCSISDGLSQLSDLVQNQEHTLEGDSKFLQRFAKQCQLSYYESNNKNLQPPSLDSHKPGSVVEKYSMNSEFACPSWQELSAQSSVSLDQHIIQLTGIQRHNMVRRLAMSKAKESNIQKIQVKADTTLMMNEFTKNLTEMRSSRDEGDLSLDALSSKFENDIKNIISSLVDFEDIQHTALQNEIQQIKTVAGVGDDIAQRIQDLVEDDRKISESLSISEESSSTPLHKKMRYVQ